MFVATKIPPLLPGPTFRELYGNVPEYVGGRPTPEFTQYINAQTKVMDAGRIQMFDSATGHGVSPALQAEPYNDYFDEVQRLRDQMLNPMRAVSDTAARSRAAEHMKTTDARPAPKADAYEDFHNEIQKWRKAMLNA